MELLGSDRLTKMTFYTTYAFLVTTGTITFIEALRTNIPAVRHIMNLETCISIVAAYFYSSFVEKLKESKEEAITEETYRTLNETRYTDWTITTPIMLLVLMLAFQYNNTLSGGSGPKGGTPLGVSVMLFIFILLMNGGMIGSGYLAETKMISKRDGLVFGFLFFFVLYGLLYSGFLMGTSGDAFRQNIFLFLVFFILWSIYGVVYWLKDEALKNTSYNILDLFSKCFVGIFFWAYFTGVFSV
jgi:bacteriorhodopsin